MPGPEDDKLAKLWALIDGCRARGVRQLKYDGVGLLDGAVAFELHPLSPSDDPILAALSEARKPIDKTKCHNCQVAAQERGSLCRACYLSQAGVSS